ADNEIYWAKRYVEFALTAKAQEDWCGKLGLTPVYPGINPPADLAGDPAYPTKAEDFAKFIVVPINLRVQHDKECFEKFKEIMQGYPDRAFMAAGADRGIRPCFRLGLPA